MSAKIKSIKIIIILNVLTAIFLFGCGIPKDPANTFEEIKRNHQIKAGVIDNPPWIEYNNGNPKGIEVDILKNLAESLKVEIVWQKSNEELLMHLLEENELDIIAGGLIKSTPYSKKVGLTIPYFYADVFAAFPENIPLTNDLKNIEVGVKENASAYYIASKQKAKIIKVKDFKNYNGIIAGYGWELTKLGYKLNDKKLYSEAHVFAISKGENKWLMFIENFIDKNKENIFNNIIKTTEYEHTK